jgi:hypothetical protein
MPSPRMHYRTISGRPPNGGRPPGIPGPNPYAGFGIPPPATPPYPPPQYFHGAYPPPPMPVVGVMPPPPPIFPMPYNYAPIGVIPGPPVFAALPPPPVLVAPPPPAAAPSPPSPPDVPGANLDGASVSFDDGVTSYIFPEKHTLIHFIRNEHQPWNYPRVQFGFTTHKVPCMMPIKELIKRLGVPGDDDENRGIVECLDRGDGYWTKGTTFKLSEDKSKQTLGEIGWTEHRGRTQKPTWLAVYKA